MRNPEIKSKQKNENYFQIIESEKEFFSLFQYKCTGKN